MKKHYTGESPLVHLVSFNKLLEYYDKQLQSDNALVVERAKHVLNTQKPYPILRDGFDDLSLIEEHKEVIQVILSDLFSPVLTKNEIKTASVPFANFVFNSSERFQQILKNAGEDFELEIKNLPDDVYYIMYCSVILAFYYGFQLDFKRPFFYNIPDANGVMRHYRILYNADFMEIIPTEKSKKLTQKDFNELLENFENVELWKEKIPPNSFISRGFVISNMFDVTAEYSISEIKSSLIANEKDKNDNFVEHFQETFRSLFSLNNISVGFAEYDSDTKHFMRIPAAGIASYILNEETTKPLDKDFCSYSYQKMIKDGSYYAITNVEKYYKKSEGLEPYKSLYEQGIRSAILAPITHEGKLMGVLELVSKTSNELNSINAVKLDDVMPFIISTVLRSMEEEENRLEAIIQKECTTVHSSVYWKFKDEAKRFLVEELEGRHPIFNEVAFKDVYPLYGQIDIKDSSKERNKAIQLDLMIHLSEINKVLKAAYKIYKLPVYEELMFRITGHVNDIKETLHTNSEQAIFDFVKEQITPVFNHLEKENEQLKEMIVNYKNQIDVTTESYYDHRRNYDESVMEINMQLAALLDKRQEEAQQMFPHYFERYKTDGVEHNLYIGSSIANGRTFDPLYLSNLRLWQLQVMCEMENKHYALKPTLPVKLDVASLMLVYSTSLAIRFRMDEKRFDVDGTYNARYEIIKKRIDKSFIKRTNERLTQKGKLAIVYSQRKDEIEYLRYVRFLKAKGYFTDNIEIVELEGLQGVTGLKAIRAEILYKKDAGSEKTYTYDDLMQELEA